MISKNIVDEVIFLALEHKRLYRIYSDKFFPNGYTLGSDLFEDSPEYQAHHEAETKLINYISELDYETIKDLQCLMYLGRDNDFTRYKGIERLIKYRESKDRDGWNSDKLVEVWQMTDKVPLGDYLIKGKEYIGW